MNLDAMAHEHHSRLLTISRNLSGDDPLQRDVAAAVVALRALAGLSALAVPSDGADLVVVAALAREGWTALAREALAELRGANYQRERRAVIEWADDLGFAALNAIGYALDLRANRDLARVSA